MTMKSMDRISMPAGDTFFREYVAQRKPVIVTDLFQQDEIRSINTLQEAKDTFGKVSLRIQTEYASAADVPSKAIDQTMTFNEYWEFVEKHKTTDAQCTEYEIPARVMTLFKLPTVCYGKDLDQQEILSLPRKYGDHDLYANVFVANRGNRAHLH